MAHHDQIDKIVFDSFMGRLSPKKQEKLDQWLIASPANRELYNNLRNSEWLLSEIAHIRSADVQERKANWEKLKKMIDEQ